MCEGKKVGNGSKLLKYCSGNNKQKEGWFNKPQKIIYYTCISNILFPIIYTLPKMYDEKNIN